MEVGGVEEVILVTSCVAREDACWGSSYRFPETSEAEEGEQQRMNDATSVKAREGASDISRAECVLTSLL